MNDTTRIPFIEKLTKPAIYDCTCKYRIVETWKDNRMVVSVCTGRCDDTDCPEHGRKESK